MESLLKSTISKRPDFYRVTAGTIVLCFIALWTIVNINRFGEYDTFKHSLLSQPFPAWFNETLLHLVPAAELIVMVLLLFNPSRKAGLYLSLGLMLCYTVYILLMLSKVFGITPCSCSSPIAGLNWVQHLWFNLTLSALAALGLFLHQKAT